LGFAILQFDNFRHTFHTKSVGKTGSFVFSTILGIAFFVSLGSVSARADLADHGSALDREDYEDHPTYQIAPSRWSIGFRGALDSFPIKTAIGNSYQFFGEWVLPFQSFGLFSFGAHFGTVPINNGSHNASPIYIQYPNFLSVMGGLQFRYQFRYARDQLIVPTASVEWDSYRFIVSDDRSEDAIGSVIGFSAGLMINIGSIDKDTAREAYSSLSLTRTYLTLEIHPLQITTPTLALSGNFIYMGLRLEFE